jgi:hypothetical protein
MEPVTMPPGWDAVGLSAVGLSKDAMSQVALVASLPSLVHEPLPMILDATVALRDLAWVTRNRRRSALLGAGSVRLFMSRRSAEDVWEHLPRMMEAVGVSPAAARAAWAAISGQRDRSLVGKPGSRMRGGPTV